jgi:hypothetical protein
VIVGLNVARLAVAPKADPLPLLLGLARSAAMPEA